MTTTPQTGTKVTFGFWGFVSGAVAAMVIGFAWGGWTTSGTTLKMSEDAVLKSRTAICIAQFMNGPNQQMKIKEFKGTDSYERAALIEKGGWDRMPGEEKATWGVAGACAEGLDARLNTGA